MREYRNVLPSRVHFFEVQLFVKDVLVGLEAGEGAPRVRDRRVPVRDVTGGVASRADGADEELIVERPGALQQFPVQRTGRHVERAGVDDYVAA